MEFLAAAYTDIGTTKETNQDSICLRRAKIAGAGEIVLAVVCDGMGGLKKGEVASGAAVQAFGEWFDKSMAQLPVICGTDFSVVRRQWTALLEDLHSRLLAYSADVGVNLGTTVAAMLTCQDRYLLVNVGDSRIYELRGSLRQLTQDQSLVAREVASGRITQEESRHHPQRNILLQCIGSGGHLTPAFYEGRLKTGAIYLLCSDGLIHEVSGEELAERLQTPSLSSKEAMTTVLHSLVEECKARGETDNITALLVRCAESGPLPEKSLFQRVAYRLGRSPNEKGAGLPAVFLVETAQLVHTSEAIDKKQ